MTKISVSCFGVTQLREGWVFRVKNYIWLKDEAL